MEKESKKVNIKDMNGTLFEKKLKYKRYDKSDCKDLYNVYTKWKALCESLESIEKRTTNIPEAVSEIAVAIIKNYYFLNQKSLKVNGNKVPTSFDCFDPITGDKIQVKACSTKKDLTSFGPDSVYDKILFVDFYDGGERNGNFTIYDIPTNLVRNKRVNQSQTLSAQAGDKRRPRTCLKDIICANSILGQSFILTVAIVDRP